MLEYLTESKRYMPVKPEVYRSRAGAIFRRADYGWGFEIADELKEIHRTARPQVSGS